MADYRYIRRAFLGSRRIKALTWMQECFFVRLMLIADDYGLFEADPAVLRATLFPQHLDKVAETDIEDCLEACHRADLLLLYENTGHQYGMIQRYGQRCMSAPKFPLPPHYTATKVSNTRWDFSMAPADSPETTETHGATPSTSETLGDSQRPSETLGLHNNTSSEHGNDIKGIFYERERGVCDTGAGDEFALWVEPLKQAHPACRRARKFSGDAVREARLAFSRLPNADKEADLLREFLAVDEDDGFFRPYAIETYFRRLESTIDNAHRWNRKRIALAPEGFVEWLTPLMNAHPALRKATALSEEVCRAALSAYKRLQDAQEHADMLAAYYESRITQDKRRKDYFRPLDGVVYFDKLESVLTNAEAWARFAEWKHPGTTAAKSSTQDTPETPRLSEEEIKTYFAELRKNIEHPQPL